MSSRFRNSTAVPHPPHVCRAPIPGNPQPGPNPPGIIYVAATWQTDFQLPGQGQTAFVRCVFDTAFGSWLGNTRSPSGQLLEVSWGYNQALTTASWTIAIASDTPFPSTAAFRAHPLSDPEAWLQVLTHPYFMFQMQLAASSFNP